jgi:hypothetical protein
MDKLVVPARRNKPNRSIAEGILALHPLFFPVAQLATVLDSGGDAEFWQDIDLKQKPKNENTDQPPNTHVFTPTFEMSQNPSTRSRRNTLEKSS